MSAVVSPADATIIVALIMAILGPIVSLWYQARVHRDNKSDHGYVREALEELCSDVRDTKADVREIKSTLREHGARLEILEDPT